MWVYLGAPIFVKPHMKMTHPPPHPHHHPALDEGLCEVHACSKPGALLKQWKWLKEWVSQLAFLPAATSLCNLPMLVVPPVVVSVQPCAKTATVIRKPEPGTVRAGAMKSFRLCVP